MSRCLPTSVTTQNTSWTTHFNRNAVMRKPVAGPEVADHIFLAAERDETAKATNLHNAEVARKERPSLHHADLMAMIGITRICVGRMAFIRIDPTPKQTHRILTDPQVCITRTWHARDTQICLTRP